MKKRIDWSKYIFLLPGLFFFSFSIVVPFFMGIHIAFTDWDGVSRTYNYVGFGNFIKIFRDQRIGQPIVNSLLFAVLGSVGSNILSLGLALLLNMKTGKLGKLARVLFFTPVCFSSVLTAFIWRFIYGEVLPDVFGISNLLGNSRTVIPAIVLMGLWNSCGVHMLIYFSGLKNISQEYYEAATIDGAGTLGLFRHVTLPLLMPAFSVCVTLSITSWLKEFACTLAATGGGPSGTSKTLSIYIYQNLYSYQKAGYGQAISLAFLAFLITVGLTVSSFFRRREIEL